MNQQNDSPLEKTLERLLTSSEAVEALKTWRQHFSSLGAPSVQKRYLNCLNQCREKLPHADFRLWVPISQINAQARRATVAVKLFLKCHGRKVGELGFDGETPPTFYPEGVFEGLLKSFTAGNPLLKIGSWHTFADSLRNLPDQEKFQDEVKRQPEWKVEAWLLDFLSGVGKGEFSPTQPVRYPQQVDGKLSYNGMFLQVSSPISAAGTTPKIATGANAHTDILVRIGRGGQRLGVLEVKALKKGVTGVITDPNIAKALKQAFCYASCYHHVFTADLLKSEGKQGILGVFGYGKPDARKTPSLTAVAVVPEGYLKQVLEEANKPEVSLASAETVMKKNGIQLEVWEYGVAGEAKFQLTRRTKLIRGQDGKLVPKVEQ